LKSNSYSEWDDLSQVTAIVEAVRQLQGSAELRAEAASNFPAVLDRLALTGAARHALAASLGLALAGGAFNWPPRGTIYWA
jgi:hypothetical protein